METIYEVIYLYEDYSGECETSVSTYLFRSVEESIHKWGELVEDYIYNYLGGEDFEGDALIEHIHDEKSSGEMVWEDANKHWTDWVRGYRYDSIMNNYSVSVYIKKMELI